MHLVATFEDKNKLDTPDKINNLISAEIPDPETDPRLDELVMKHMLHGPCGAWCQKDGKCSKKIPKNFQEETIIDEEGYPKYRRRDNGKFYFKNGSAFNNRHVVSYIAQLLLKYNCHINVEVLSTVLCIKYIHKYIFKGYDAAAMSIERPMAMDRDEIKAYIKSRYVSAIEAASF